MSILRRVLRAPPAELPGRVWRKCHRTVRRTTGRLLDSHRSTYLSIAHGAPLHRYFTPIDPRVIGVAAELLLRAADSCLQHRFDILGSGPVGVSHGGRYEGLDGCRYEGLGPTVDRKGRWLASIVSAANLAESTRMWRLIDEGYVPIDWQRDFKSGYRWSERTWYGDIRHSHVPGADIKVPWELARMNHMPQLALAFALSAPDSALRQDAEKHGREFRNALLDFIATNPPRFGVNWACTMDVAIRAANWLLAYDIFRAYGYEFDAPFEAILARSIHEHGRHVVANLEWEKRFRGNHYLANVAGLLFIAAYLPASAEIDAWLAFALQELIAEVGHQFHPDGSNFEASTCYHRLSAEMVAYSTALTLGLPEEKQAALRRYDNRAPGAPPRLAAPPLSVADRSGAGFMPFPQWYVARLSRMAAFTRGITRPDGRVIQIGDNDSGRFLALAPDADSLDHSELIAAVDGLMDPSPCDCLGAPHVASAVVRSLAGGRHLLWDGDADVGVMSLRSYRDFGLYVFRSERFFLAFRCGAQDPKTDGAHAHNDQLSIEVTVDGSPVIVDPGSYLYTPLPRWRNRLRSTTAHSTLSADGREQNAIDVDKHAIFMLRDRTRARVVAVDSESIIAEHEGFGAVHRRHIALAASVVRGRDQCDVAGEKELRFLLAPGVKVALADGGSGTVLTVNGLRILLAGGPGSWSIEDSHYSRSYGMIEPTSTVVLRTGAVDIEWSLNLSA